MKTDDPPPMRSGGEARSVEARPQPMARRPTIFIFLLWPPQRYSASCRPLRPPLRHSRESGNPGEGYAR